MSRVWPLWYRVHVYTRGRHTARSSEYRTSWWVLRSAATAPTFSRPRRFPASPELTSTKTRAPSPCTARYHLPSLRCWHNSRFPRHFGPLEGALWRGIMLGFYRMPAGTVSSGPDVGIPHMPSTSFPVGWPSSGRVSHEIFPVKNHPAPSMRPLIKTFSPFVARSLAIHLVNWPNLIVHANGVKLAVMRTL